MTVSQPAVRDLTDAARDIADRTCARYAAEVDRDARFPVEAVDALRAYGVMSAAVPVEQGGPGADVPTLAAIASTLAHGCAATAMVWAMNQIQLACLARHGADSATVRELIAGFVAEQSLIASGTSERGIGGDLRASHAAVMPGATAPVRRVEKEAATVSYGEQADAILLTARSGPDAAPGDQVGVIVVRGQFTLEPRGGWNSLGMRGTCSPGFGIRAEFPAEQVLVAFHQIAAATMVPLSHVLWSAVWVGLAEEAFDRAARFAKARSANAGQAPPAVLAEAHWRLSAARSQLDAAAGAVTEMWSSGQVPTTSFLAQLNALKLGVSETAVAVVQQALRCTGMAGYSEEGPHSVARLLRDVLSAPLMVSNDRLLATNAGLALLGRDRAGIPRR